MEDSEFFYLVWNSGKLDSRQQRSSIDAAKLEAQRLALCNPGKRFYVLKAEGFAVHKTAEWTDCNHDPEMPF